MRIKKIYKNEYILSKEKVWVRNLCKNNKSIDINQLYKKENDICIQNEFQNLRLPKLDLPKLSFETIIICSDGLFWNEKQEILKNVPNESKIIGTNGSLKKWKMVGSEAKIKKSMYLYLVNNPYKECMSFLPKNHRYYPNIVCSIRTCPEFLKNYKNKFYFYKPSENLDYSTFPNMINLVLDDYRNPICAAISLSYKFNVKNIILFCCDESFIDYREGSVKMDNGYYQYPQQIMSQNIIDKQLYWLRQEDINIFDHSSGIKYENAEYINEEQLISFFSKECKNE